MALIKIFSNPRFGEVRTYITGEGIPMFVGKDVAKALGFRDTVNAVRKHVDDCDKQRCQISTSGGLQYVTLINESGLYSLVLRSQTKQARDFKQWVTSEVLPQIARTGGYIPVEQDDEEKEILAKALQIAQRTIEHQADQLESQEDDVRFALAIGLSEDTCSIAQLAKLIYDLGVNIGQNRLFEWMREHGYLGTVGVHYNVPVQRYIESGLFKVKTSKAWFDDRGIAHCKVTPLVTGKGQRYFIDIFINKGVA